MKRKKIKIPDRPERLLIIFFIVCLLITVFVVPVSACSGCDGSPTEPACCHASPCSTGKTSTASGGVGDATSGSSTHIGTLTYGGTFDSGNGFTFVIGGNEKTLITCNQLDSYKVENIQATERAWPDLGADGQTYLDTTFDPLAGYGVNDPPGQDLTGGPGSEVSPDNTFMFEFSDPKSGSVDDADLFTVNVGNVNDPPDQDLATDFDVALTYNDDPVLESPFSDSGRAADTGGETFKITVPDSGDESTGETTGDGVTLTVEDSTGDTTPVVNENALDMVDFYRLDTPDSSVPLTISAPDPGDGSTGTETFTVDFGNSENPYVSDPVTHYQEYGYSESTSPETNFYRRDYSDKTDASIDNYWANPALEHYQEYGDSESRSPETNLYSGTSESSIVQWSETSGTDYWTSLWSSANEQNAGEEVVESDGVETFVNAPDPIYQSSGDLVHVYLPDYNEATTDTKKGDVTSGWSPSETTTFDDSGTSLYGDYYFSVFGDTLSSGEKNKDSETSGTEKITKTISAEGITSVIVAEKDSEGNSKFSATNYDEKGNKVGTSQGTITTDAQGNKITTETHYDEDGNKIGTSVTKTNPDGDKEVKGYDTDGNQVLDITTKTTSAEGITSFEVIEKDSEGNGDISATHYDEEGNKVGTSQGTIKTDAQGNEVTTRIHYDKDGNKMGEEISNTDSKGNKVTTLYDSEGQQIDPYTGGPLEKEDGYILVEPKKDETGDKVTQSVRWKLGLWEAVPLDSLKTPTSGDVAGGQ